MQDLPAPSWQLDSYIGQLTCVVRNAISHYHGDHDHPQSRSCLLRFVHIVTICSKKDNDGLEFQAVPGQEDAVTSARQKQSFSRRSQTPYPVMIKAIRPAGGGKNWRIVKVATKRSANLRTYFEPSSEARGRECIG